MKRRLAAFSAALSVMVAAALVAVAAPAWAATGSPSNSLNLSDNPILATNLNGWSVQEGGTNFVRVPVTDHVVARYAARVESTGSTTRVRAPRESVVPGEVWTFAADVKASRAGTRVQITVSWFGTAGFITWTGGQSVAVNATNWTRVAFADTVPAGATHGETVINYLGTARRATVHATQHDVRAPVVAPPTTTTTTPTTTTTTEPSTSTTEPPTTTTDPLPTSTVPPTTTTAPTTTTTTPPPPAGITLQPTQPVGFVYNATGVGSLAAYQQPGAMVVAGRDNYAAPEFAAVSQAGGTVLVYLDPVIDNAYGRYHELLITASECGPAVPRWPGSPQANQYGYLNDFRVGSPLHTKLECVLEKMVAENPHMGGWFIDDLGSRSWFPMLNWDTFGSTNQQAYRDGAIAVAQTVRAVADRHGLMFVVNGTWNAGSTAANGGGYPNQNAHGLSLAEGGTVEYHPVANEFWLNYISPSAQWGAASPITGAGKPVMLVIGETDSERQQWVNAGVAFYTTQTSTAAAPTPWGPFHPTGLPTRVGS